MSIAKFPAEKKDKFIPAGESGSYETSQTLQPGIYIVETDTTQNLSASNFYVVTDDGFKFESPIRGGLGYIELPLPARNVNVTAGTFPLPINFRESAYAMTTPVSASITDYLPASLSFAVDLPEGSSGFNVYWTDGSSASISGSAASLAVPTSILPTPVANVNGLKVAVGARDANNVISKIDVATLTAVYPFVPAPSAVTIDFTGIDSASITASVDASSASVAVYWPNDTTSVISGSTGTVSVPDIYDIGDSVILDIGSLEADGSQGLAASFDLGQFPWAEYLASDVIDPIAGVEFYDVYLVAGGGGTNNIGGPRGMGAAGGGGGGEVTYTPAHPITAPVSLTIGAGGAIGSVGTATTLGPSLSSTGGSNGIGGFANSPGSIRNPAPGGASGSGNPGWGGSFPGGAAITGGGGGGEGAAATTSTGAVGYTTIFSTPVAGGGGGGGSGAGTGTDGGGNGTGTPTPSTLATRVGDNGAANRGGGGGGSAGYSGPSGPTSWSAPGTTGGSGRAILKAIF